MKLITWNVYRLNRKIGKLPNFLTGLSADVMCLQEVPLAALPQLAEVAPYMATCREFDPHKKKMETQLVILSRHPITTHTRVEHGSPPATSLAAKWTGKCEGKEFHFIDITLKGQDLRIFNVHLPLKVSPSFRLEELAFLRKYLAPERKNLICGDFNSFGGPIVNPFWGWYFGYKRHDYTIHERRNIETLMRTHGLHNPFSGKRTHNLLNIQLDYILVPEDIPLLQTQILPHRCGSDHFPLLMELAL